MKPGRVDTTKFRLSPVAAAVLAIHTLPAAAQQAAEVPAATEPARAGPSPARATELHEVRVEAELPSAYKAEKSASPTKYTEPLRVYWMNAAIGGERERIAAAPPATSSRRAGQVGQ